MSESGRNGGLSTKGVIYVDARNENPETKREGRQRRMMKDRTERVAAPQRRDAVLLLVCLAAGS